MRINLYISDSEARNLEILVKKYGGKNTSFLRTLLKEAYEKEFGGYKSTRKEVLDVQPQEELTPEQYCERFGGKVIRSEDGMMKCSLSTKGGGSSHIVPLSMTERIEEVSKQLGLV